ncbi:MAG TPA: EF-hand domain-containing protein [Bradyrhizobium sp.]|nr:EF-hand domain-containing protein [Bradyrhizobium sp.]
MFPILGAASSAIDALAALTSLKPSSGTQKDATNPFAFSPDASASTGAALGSGSRGGPSISPQTMSALLAAQSQSGTTGSAPMSRSEALKDLFAQIDANGDGKITKTEFEDALGAGGTNLAQADDVFGKLDKDGNGSVSLDEMSRALKGGRGHHGHHHAANASGDSANDPLMQALQGATTTSTTNADGSVTTSLTYADGSQVTMTSAAGANASGPATSSHYLVEKLIQRQANLISAQTLSSLSVSV